MRKAVHYYYGEFSWDIAEQFIVKLMSKQDSTMRYVPHACMTHNALYRIGSRAKRVTIIIILLKMISSAP